jgi:hypothetical protein
LTKLAIRWTKWRFTDNYNSYPAAVRGLACAIAAGRLAAPEVSTAILVCLVT